jgi:acetaldehyde dehydrogenase/alcohol dehydrogenase
VLRRRGEDRPRRGVAAGAPENCIQWIEEPSMEASGELMNHPGVALILATGGNAMVRAAYSCGKPALGVGAGNVPAFIERTAKVGRAVNDIVLSKSFDMGMVCASEQAVILDEPIAAEALAEFARLHAYMATADEKRMLEEFIFGVTADSENCAGAKLNPDRRRPEPQWIAEHAGFTVPETRRSSSPRSGVGPHEPLTREKLAPVLAVLRATSPPRASTSPARWSTSTASATRVPSTPTTRTSSPSSARSSRPSASSRTARRRSAASVTSTTPSCRR